MLNERLRRVTDLFVEGTEIYMGMDAKGEAIVVWVNKLNSFEHEEARRDGVAARGMRAAELGPDSNEFKLLQTLMGGWDDEKLCEYRLTQMSDTLYLRALNDLEVDPEWRDNVDLVRRGTSVLDDAGVPDDDPRRANIAELQVKYLAAVAAAQEKVKGEALRDLKENTRKDNENDYIEAWRNENSVDVFLTERRITELFRAMRDCKAKVIPAEDHSKMLFDHEQCDHSLRICKDRTEVRELPGGLIDKAIAALEQITVGIRDSGNSGAPASSSASLERSSVEEETSVLSTPEETPLAAATT